MFIWWYFQSTWHFITQKHGGPLTKIGSWGFLNKLRIAKSRNCFSIESIFPALLSEGGSFFYLPTFPPAAVCVQHKIPDSRPSAGAGSWVLVWDFDLNQTLVLGVRTRNRQLESLKSGRVDHCSCSLCVSVDYPWRWNNQLLMSSSLIKWIYLPDFYTVPNSKNLMGQFGASVWKCWHLSKS